MADGDASGGAHLPDGALADGALAGNGTSPRDTAFVVGAASADGAALANGDTLAGCSSSLVLKGTTSTDGKPGLPSFSTQFVISLLVVVGGGLRVKLDTLPVSLGRLSPRFE